MENEAGLQDQTVQATMLLPVYGRAKASRMFPDILRDDGAIRIVDSMDYDFTRISKSYATEYGSLCCLLRAKRLDERCLAYIREHPNGTVVNLGSGLDTTFDRVDNGSIRWYNIDLPDAMAFRQRFIPAPERCADVAKSMFDYTWLGEVETADGSVFILAGGLFYYFEETQVRGLIARVAKHFPRGEIFFDAQSKTAVKISNRMVRKAGNKGSEMKFWVKDAQKLKSWSSNIRKVEGVPFCGCLWKENRFKLLTRVNICLFNALKMGQLISVRWGGSC
ncbi:MAG: class I SAM-dependent methyltransferase [Oscillospiraceae bacterium]|jgi:O-methyltransferase involved in polyketide biosynthesis|nr:class I SAM-dependent methyltransferase [Oscillospiraceae bacterium]